MAQTVGRSLATLLRFLNFSMYVVVMGFASWNLNKYIIGQIDYAHVAGKSTTISYLIFSILASVFGIAPIFLGGHRKMFWRNESPCLCV